MPKILFPKYISPKHPQVLVQNERKNGCEEFVRLQLRARTSGCTLIGNYKTKYMKSVAFTFHKYGSRQYPDAPLTKENNQRHSCDTC